MNSGNHIADQADKERERKGLCGCGGQLEEIDWCEPEHCRCEQLCGNNLEDTDCPVIETRLKCKRCGSIFEEGV